MPRGFNPTVAPQWLVYLSVCLSACSGSGPLSPQDTAPTALRAAANLPVGAEILSPPVLSFNDTGLSVTDGVTRNGLWDVESAGLGWEFSLDQGASWTRGVGQSFEVKDDGAQLIWVRARDDAGNTSKIVRVNCVLDTMAPTALSVQSQFNGHTHTLLISGLEAGARWEYSLDQQRTWLAGQGAALALLGNALTDVRLRQVDLAGNASEPRSFDALQQSMLAHAASNQPALPSVLAAGAYTHVIHGTVSHNDTDHVTWEVTKGQRLFSVRPVHAAPTAAPASFTLQTGRVFDAGAASAQVLVQSLGGPRDEASRPVHLVPKSPPSDGAMTLRIQHDSVQPIVYAIEVVLLPVD